MVELKLQIFVPPLFECEITFGGTCESFRVRRMSGGLVVQPEMTG
jgi:hypothetical protein